MTNDPSWRFNVAKRWCRRERSRVERSELSRIGNSASSFYLGIASILPLTKHYGTLYQDNLESSEALRATIVDCWSQNLLLFA